MALRLEKSIFYHIPKTGGIFVENILKKLDKKEIARYVFASNERPPHGLVRKHTVPGIERGALFSFCFVRHPIEWYKSFWNWRIGTDGKKLRIRRRCSAFLLDKCWDSNFENFIEKSLQTFPEGFVSRLYQYYTKEDCKGVDFIGRQENLREDLIKALKLANESLLDETLIKNYSRQNVSPGVLNVLNLDKNLEREVIKAEHWLIDNFYSIIK